MGGERPVRLEWAAFAGVFALTFACFVPALHLPLLAWDDACYVVQNPVVRAFSLEGAARAFTGFHCNYWAPLTWLSLMADASLFGADPRGHHATSLLLHAVNAALCLLLLFRLTGRLAGLQTEPTGRHLPVRAVAVGSG